MVNITIEYIIMIPLLFTQVIVFPLVASTMTSNWQNSQRNVELQDAADHLKYISIDIDKFTDELIVKTLQPKFSDGRGYNVNYTITVPTSLNLTVKNVNGKISGKVSMPSNGTVDMSLENGSIELDIPQNTSADFSASLVNGSISVHNLTLKNKVETKRSLQGTLGDGEGLITLRTTNGNITALGF